MALNLTTVLSKFVGLCKGGRNLDGTTSFILLSEQMKVERVVSKGNGYNYYGYTDDGSIVEVIKDVVGRFYRCKLIIGEWLVKQGNPLTNFTLIE